MAHRRIHLSLIHTLVVVMASGSRLRRAPELRGDFVGIFVSIPRSGFNERAYAVARNCFAALGEFAWIQIALLNGSFVPLDDAKVSVLDPAVSCLPTASRSLGGAGRQLIDNASCIWRAGSVSSARRAGIAGTPIAFCELQKRLIARNQIEMAWSIYR